MICGMDGCKAGWIAVFKKLSEPRLEWVVFENLGGILDRLETIEIIAIDIPIGLTEAGPRECDLLARKRLGGKRGSSVFPAPNRAALKAKYYLEACELQFMAAGKKMTRQTFHILSKIRQVQEWIERRPDLSRKIFEVHPEVSFQSMAGGVPTQHRKKNSAGKQERIDLLRKFFPVDRESIRARKIRDQVEEDDLIDALAALWTAERISSGRHEILPGGNRRERNFPVINV